VAASTYGQIAVMTAIFTLFSGWWVDRLRPGFMIALQMLGLCAATGLAMVMTSSNLLFVYTLAFGIFMGIGSVFDGTVWVNMFGREHQGAIRGFVATAGVIGAAIGPIVFGVAYDHLGSYNPSIWLGIVLAMIIMVSGLLVKLPTQNR
jgi:MFS family permease